LQDQTDELPKSKQEDRDKFFFAIMQMLLTQMVDELSEDYYFVSGAKA
jgi:hypothetical protein